MKLEHREQQVFLGFEEMIKTAGIGLGSFQNLGDTGGGVSVEREQIECRIDKTLAGWFWG
jgi:hypothetical protein